MRALIVLFLATGCAGSHHAHRLSTLGTPSSTAALAALVDQPGTVEIETVTSATWAVPRERLVNLHNPRAKELKKGMEPIEVDFHVLRHPTRGTFLVDTGAEKKLRDDPTHAAVNGLVAKVLSFRTMNVVMPLADWITQHPEPIRGVILTHLHPDHISGLVDAPDSAVVYTGPREIETKLGHNLVLERVNDRALAGKPPVEELPFQKDPSGRFEGVTDVFGDGMVWAIHVPGHTHGSIAILARTPKGPVLLLGDASHTRWGWEHAVEPGSLSDDQAASATSLARLEAFAKEHPSLDVRPGHQR